MLAAPCSATRLALSKLSSSSRTQSPSSPSAATAAAAASIRPLERRCQSNPGRRIDREPPEEPQNRHKIAYKGLTHGQRTAGRSHCPAIRPTRSALACSGEWRRLSGERLRQSGIPPTVGAATLAGSAEQRTEPVCAGTPARPPAPLQYDRHLNSASNYVNIRTHNGSSDG